MLLHMFVGSLFRKVLELEKSSILAVVTNVQLDLWGLWFLGALGSLWFLWWFGSFGLLGRFGFLGTLDTQGSQVANIWKHKRAEESELRHSYIKCPVFNHTFRSLTC